MSGPVPPPEPLAASEARLRAIVGAIPDQYFRIREDGTYLEMVDHGVPSPLDRERIVGTRVQDAPMPAEVKALILGGITRAIATGELQTREYRLPVGGELRDREARMVRCGEGEALVLVRDITQRKRAEEELRRVNAVQSLILENSAIGIAFVRRRVFEWANARVSQLLGLPPEQIRGASTRVIYPDDEAYAALGRDAYPRMALGERTETELQMRRSDGSLFWCRYVGVALDPADVHEGSIWLFEDVTDRKRAEERLQENLHFLQVLLDAIPSPVFYKGADGRYQGCNQAMENFLGLPREQLVGRTAAEIAPPELARAYQEADAALLTSPGTQVYQARVQAAGGEVREVVFHKAVFWNLLGDVAGLVGVILDITERERAARELADTKVLLEAILEQSPTPIVVVDAPGGGVRVCNRAARECLGILGESPSLGISLDAVRRSWREVDAEGVPVPLEELPLARALQGEAMPARELRVLRKDGTERVCLAFGVPVFDREGRLLAGMAIFPDITERRRAEEALRQAQKLESLGLMAEGIAHDFNNLFQGLQGLLERIRPQAETEGGATLARALQVLDRAAELSARVQEYSGKSHREAGALDLNQAVKEALELLPGLFPRVPPVWLSLAPDLPETEGDRDQIRRVLTSLLSNAVEASPGGGGLIEVFTGVVPGDAAWDGEGLWVEPPKAGRQLRLTIRDQGCGIPAEHLDRIFDPFFTTREPGRGLGLAAALGILRAHGAGLHVASEPGKGACFRIFLPVREVVSPVGAAVLPPPKGRAVLLVDDEPLLLEVMGDAIRDVLGLPLLLARDGQEAVEVFQAHCDEVGLVLMDATMPRLTGPEAFEAMKRIRPGLRAILCSGFSETFGEATAQSHGFLSFLKKPFSLATLQEAVRKAMEG